MWNLGVSEMREPRVLDTGACEQNEGARMLYSFRTV